MSEWLYAFSSTCIATLLLALVLVALEAGYRFGRRNHAVADDSVKDQTKAIDASMLGLLSLLLGFTFTMALQHHDTRHHAMVAEANAIGTAVMRAQLLPAPHDQRSAQLLRSYVDVRLEAGDADLAQSHPFKELAQKTSRMQQELWAEALAAARKDPGPVTTGLYVQALGDLMDAQAERNAALERHIPEYIVALLLWVAIAGALVTGYSAGLGGARPAFGTAAFAVVVALVVFMIADLDRPRRGIIQVGQENLIELQAGMRGEAPH